MVIVPFGSEFLALEDDDFQRALERGREYIPKPKKEATPPPGNSVPTIVDAAGAEKATGVPKSWWLDAARKRKVPRLKLGKYVRFDLADVTEAAKTRGKE